MKKSIIMVCIFSVLLLIYNVVIADTSTYRSLRTTTQAVNHAVKSSIRASFRTYRLREELNLYQSPSASASVIKTLKKGTIIAPSGRSQGRWQEISDNQNNGWVYSYSAFQ